MNVQEELERAETAKGTSGLSTENAILLITELTKRSLPVHSLEAYQVIEGQREKPLRIVYSVLGLDGDSNWENHKGFRKLNELATGKFVNASEEKTVLECLILVLS